MRGPTATPRSCGGGRWAAVFGVVLVVAAGCGSGGAGATTINLYYAPEQNLQKVVDACNLRAAGRYRIVYNKLPRAADGQREQMVRRLAASDTGMDVLGLDVTWTAEFAEAGWIREWTGENRTVAETGTLAGPLASAQWKNKLYAATKNTNVQLLWYRGDVVSTPPRTFGEMIELAKRLKQGGKPSTILLTGAQYEGLVVQFNTLTHSAGGHILSANGGRVVLDDGAIQALGVLRDLATSGVTSPSLTNSQEDDIRLAFESGAAAFELNWPYVYPAMQKDKPDLAKQVKWARYPGVRPEVPSRVTIGGYNLAVSTFSRHPNEAFDAALCLRSAENQKFSAINDGVPPTIESLYADPEVATAYPMKDTILAELRDSVIRPKTPAYQNASTVISTILSPPSDIAPQPAVDRLRRELRNAIESKGVLP